jgi:HEAT repeat protein
MSMPRPSQKIADPDRWFKALESPEWETRLNAAEALGKLKEKRALNLLLSALADEDEYVREGAAWALGQIADTVAVSSLVKALKDGDKYVRKVRCRPRQHRGPQGCKAAHQGLKRR